MKQEIQPVILAAGSGSRMYPLTEEIPKALLPVGNFPLICYPIAYLKKLGFEDCIIVILKSAIHQFTLLKNYGDQNFKIDFVTIPDDEELQTGESLNEIKDRVKCDLLIMSCDSILEAPFHRLADLHRAHNATLTVLLSSQIDMTSEREGTAANKKGIQSQVTDQRDLVAVDEGDKRLLFLANEADIDNDAVVIKKSLLKRYPQLVIRNGLVDMHIYLMKQWVLDYVSENRSLSSIKGDIIPHLVSKQFSTWEHKESQVPESVSDMAEGDPIPDIFSFAQDIDEYSNLTRDWSFCANVDKEKGFQDCIKCHAYVNKEGFCLRVNTLPAYLYINRQITKLLPTLLPMQDIQLIHPLVNRSEKSQIGADCMVGESSKIGENVSIKRSIVGKHCIIKSKVKISNCVIMDHVVIEEKCNLQGSIVCSNAYIKEQAMLKDCQVGNGVTIKAQADIKNEAIVQEVMDFDD